VDVVLFYNDYDDLFTVERGIPFLQTATSLPPHMLLPTSFQNGADAVTYGVELAANWQATEKWKVSANYGYVYINVDLMPGSTDSLQINAETGTPKHIFNIRSALSLADNVDLYNILFFNDDFFSKAFTTEQNVPQHWRLDSRLRWKLNDNLELSLTGQNLLDDRHPEFAAPLFGSLSSEIGRSYFARVTYRN